MPVLPVLTLIIGGITSVLEPATGDTLRSAPRIVESREAHTTDGVTEPPPRETNSVIATPVGARLSFTTAVIDTPTTRRAAVEIGDWYGRRLLIHRVTALAVPALFAYQYYLGDRLYDGRAEGDDRDTHRMMRTAIIGAFGVNAVTGAWNLWESRTTSEGRTSRVLHTASMVAALGGFTYAGIKLADDMKEPGVDVAAVRRQHRAVALTSMGVTLVSGAAMWLVNR